MAVVSKGFGDVHEAECQNLKEGLSGLDTSNLVGHLAAWNYFQSAESDLNEEFVQEWKSVMG